MQSGLGYLSLLIAAAVIAGQWLLIWRLLNRLLVQAHIPSLGPVRTTPPAEAPERPQARKKLFSATIPE